MRVAFVSAITSFHETVDEDRAARVENVARRLAERGHEVCIFCTPWWNGEHEAFEEGDVVYRGIDDLDRF
ncbi:MAG: glycosyl transferase family 1, partial [Halobacteriaceae archaeon]